MEIGQPQKVITIQPLEEPIGLPSPVETPQPVSVPGPVAVPA